MDGVPLARGDRVTFSLVASCGQCFFCTEAGLPQKCRSLLKYGHRPVSDRWPLTGGLAQYVYLQPGTSVCRVPEEVSDTVAATAMCAGATIGQALSGMVGKACGALLLIGMGMLGAWGVRVGLERGFDRILAVDVDQERLEGALRAGATAVLCSRGLPPDAVEAFVKEHTGGRGADTCIELSGKASAVQAGLAALRVGGTLKLVGSVVPGESLQLDPYANVTRMTTIQGVHNYHPKHLAAALDLVTDRFHHDAVQSGIGQQYPLCGVDGAFRSTERREALRVAITFG